MSPATATNTQSTTTLAITATGDFREYPLPQSDSQMMRPAIDHEGRLWFGEMGRKFLAVFDPQTQAILQMTPPRGRNGVMAVQVAPDDTIWFVEQYANYIGHYFPETGRYHIYPLPTLTIPDPGTGRIRFFMPSGPIVSLMEIASDTHGIIWVTSFSTGLLLRLDPRTGKFTPYYAPFTGPGTGGLYGLVVTPTGEIWVTVLAENVVARLDVVARRFIYYAIPTPGSEPLGIVMGAYHTLWFTEVDKIGMLQP